MNMATSKSFLEFITEQLSELEEVKTRPMMGEYLLYYRGKLVGDICDDRLLVKITPSSEAMLPDAPRELPYDGAKTPMILVDNLDDRDHLKQLLEAMYGELPDPKPKKPKKNA